MGAAAAAGAVLAFTPLVAGLTRELTDLQLRWLAPAQASSDVVVFDIDDASLAALKPHFGGWPFGRDVYALAIEQLRDLGARAIAIDLFFAEGHHGDAALARAIERPGAPVVLAAAGLRHPSDGHPPPPRAEAAAAPGDAAALAGTPAHAWPALALPAPGIWPGGRPPPLGVVTSPLDSDGQLRTMPLWHDDGARRLPTLPWAMRLVADDRAALPPLDRAGHFTLAWPAAAAWPPVRRFSELAEVALMKADPATLRAAVQGRVVFIGSSALLADRAMTPRGQVSGTVALAEAYAQLRRAGGAADPPAAAARARPVRPNAPLLDGALLVASLVPALVAVRRGRPVPRRDALAAGAGAVLLLGVAGGALAGFGQITSWLPPLGALAAGLAAALLTHQRGQVAVRTRLAHELAVSEQAALAKSAFLANVSHEIRTPLNALLGVAELLAQTELTARQRLHVQVFRESGQALHALINDLLDLSKIEAGRLELDPAPFDLHHSLQHLVTLLRPRADDKGIELRLQVEPALPRGVRGDRLRFEQALLNLLSNALKFTARGAVTLRAAREAGSADLLRFEVADTGIGIEAGKLEAIFEPFAQADGSITRSYGGTGLGLAITREVATLMGGSVQVQSTPGEGSVFTLRLALPEAELAAAPAAPAAAAALPEAASAGAPDAADGAGRLPALSVLLAEDNEVNAYIFRNMLEAEPLDIHYATHGAQALQLLRQRRFDIAFLDVHMPGLDGLSVTRELRALEAAGGRMRTPVVALTASAFAGDVRASLDAGCDAHVAKPFSRAQLVDAITRLAAPAGHDNGGNEGAPPAAAALDREGALQRLGGDTRLYERLVAQASPFLTGWALAFEDACRDGSRVQAHRLAHDLKSIAAALGAQRLSEHAAELERSLAGAEGGACSPDAAAWQRTVAALAPAMTGLGLAPPAER